MRNAHPPRFPSRLICPTPAAYKDPSEPTLFSLLEDSDEAHSPGEHPLSHCLKSILTCLFLLRLGPCWPLLLPSPPLSPVLAQIYIFTIYPGPKFTQPTFTQNPNLHNTKFTPDPNLHDPRFTPPQIYKTQIYTKPDIHSLNFTQNPNLQSPKFTQSQIYNTKICIKFRPNISFKGKDNSDECRTHSWTRGSSVASGSLRPFGPVSRSNVARGSNVGT